MPAFQVAVVDVDPQANQTSSFYEGVNSRVTNLFRAVVINPTSGFNGVNVTWYTCANFVPPPPTAFLVYLIDTSFHGIIQNIGAPSETSNRSLLGYTAIFGNATASEVYVRQDLSARSSGNSPRRQGSVQVLPSPTLIANTIFHEAMHFKTGLGDAMHSHTGGLAQGNVPDRDMSPTQDDIALFAPHLATTRALWMGGCAAYARMIQNERNVGRDLGGI
jgi:hypothetical protein